MALRSDRRMMVFVREELPSGTVTFLFTDVEGSTRLLHELGPERYAEALAEHRRVIREACASHGGVEVDTQGDAFFFAFRTAPGALAAVSALTEALASGPVQVRVGLHTGTPLVTDEGYVGGDVHRAARIAAAGHGGQVLVSASTAALIDPSDTVSQGLFDLGEHRFKDLAAPERVYQLGGGDFPPLKSLYRTNLPVPATPFLGRERELAEVVALLSREDVRLLTLTGPGGTGKTRLALQAAAEASERYPDGISWVPLAPLRDPALLLPAVAQSLELVEEPERPLAETLTAFLAGKRALLLLDNAEHLLPGAAHVLAELDGGDGPTLLVTSRERLQLQREQLYAVPTLAEPDGVALFLARARSLDPGFAGDGAVAELCARLDSLPLALELAAARTVVFSPEQLLARLSHRLDLLKGARDADPRQQTLRATIEWSYDLLDADEKRLFRRLSVFVAGCTYEAAEEVCGADPDTLQSLLDKSLLRRRDTDLGPRYWMLETIAEFAGERLDAAESDAVRRRLRKYIVSLSAASARDLHTVAESATSARLAPDYPNVRAAVSYALAAGEPDDVGRILGAIYPFLISHGYLGEVSEWTEAALAARNRLSTRGLAEALAGGGEIARFAGDLDRAVELKEELAALQEELAAVQVDLHRPNWRTAMLADLADIAVDRHDFAGARRYAEECAAAGGGARAALCLAEVALRQGDLESAQAEARTALAGYEEGAFNHACGLEILAEVARRAGNVPAARDRFRDALRSFVALGDGGHIADCLDGLGRLAADVGDGERAGRLHGVAERLRETRGRRPIRADLAFPDVPDDALEEGRAMRVEDALEYALEATRA